MWDVMSGDALGEDVSIRIRLGLLVGRSGDCRRVRVDVVIGFQSTTGISALKRVLILASSSYEPTLRIDGDCAGTVSMISIGIGN